MTYYRQSPSPSLRPFVDHFWLLDGFPAATHREQILPDGGVELIFNFGERQRLYAGRTSDRFVEYRQSWLSGQRTGSIVIGQSPKLHFAGIRFRPCGVYPVLHVPACEVADRVVEFDQVLGAEATQVRDRLGAAHAPREVFCILEAFVSDRLKIPGREWLLVDRAVARMASFPHQTPIDDVVRLSGISHKQLTRLFARYVGIGPKEFCRVQRFQRTLRLIERASHIRWTEIAAAGGYADQSHMVREFREFSGNTPTSYLPQRGEYLNYLPLGG